MALDFRITAAVAAAVFAVLTVAQLFALATRRAEQPAEKTSVLGMFALRAYQVVDAILLVIKALQIARRPRRAS